MLFSLDFFSINSWNEPNKSNFPEIYWFLKSFSASCSLPIKYWIPRKFRSGHILFLNYCASTWIFPSATDWPYRSDWNEFSFPKPQHANSASDLHISTSGKTVINRCANLSYFHSASGLRITPFTSAKVSLSIACTIVAELVFVASRRVSRNSWCSELRFHLMKPQCQAVSSEGR